MTIYGKYNFSSGLFYLCRGAMVVKALAVNHSSSCRGIHSNMPLISPPTFFRNPIRYSRAVLGVIGLPGGYSTRELKFLKETQEFEKFETGYSRIQGTKPQVRNAT